MNSERQKIIVLEKVGSTNNYAMALVQNGLACKRKCCFRNGPNQWKRAPREELGKQ